MQNPYFQFVMLFFTAIFISACGAKEKAPGVALPEAVTTDQRSFENGIMHVRVYPWQDGSKVNLENLLMKNRLKGAPGQKVRNQKHQTFPSKLADNAFYLVRDLQAAGGRKRFSVLTACRATQGDGDYVRLIDVYGDLDALTRDKRKSSAFMKGRVREACGENPGKARKKLERAKVRQAVRTRPGKGVKPSKIKAVLVTSDQGYSGDFMSIDYPVTVLFKDGWAYRDPIALADFDIKSSRKLESDRWSRWKGGGKNYKLRKPDQKKWQKIEYSWRIKPQKTGKRIEGYFDYTSASGSMYYGSFISRGSYSFRKDGTYKASSSSQFGGNTVASDLGLASVNSFSYCDSTGGSSIVSGTAPNVVTSSKKSRKGCGDGKAGKYEIKNYTLTLFANNGQTHRLPFYMLSKDWLLINGQSYRRDKD